MQKSLLTNYCYILFLNNYVVFSIINDLAVKLKLAVIRKEQFDKDFEYTKINLFYKNFSGIMYIITKCRR